MPASPGISYPTWFSVFASHQWRAEIIGHPRLSDVLSFCLALALTLALAVAAFIPNGLHELEELSNLLIYAGTNCVSQTEFSERMKSSIPLILFNFASSSFSPIQLFPCSFCA